MKIELVKEAPGQVVLEVADQLIGVRLYDYSDMEFYRVRFEDGGYSWHYFMENTDELQFILSEVKYWVQSNCENYAQSAYCFEE